MERKSFDLRKGQGLQDIKISSDYNDRLLNKINAAQLKEETQLSIPKIKDFIYKDKMAGISFLLAGISLIVVNVYGLNFNIDKFLYQANQFFSGVIHFNF